MKVGDLVRWKNGLVREPWRPHPRGVIASEIRHGVNSSFVDVLVDGKIIPVNWLALEVISEGR